jgi:hypothetical protein
MSADQLETMHRDHAEWRSENGLWREEVRNWEYDFYRAKGALADLGRNFEAYDSELATYAASINLYDEELHAHEHEMAQRQLHSRPGDPPQGPSEKHARGAEHHARQRQRHDAVKERHHRIMKHWNALMKALEEGK